MALMPLIPHRVRYRKPYYYDLSLTVTGCSYRWYTTAQICEILQKFDGIAFVGDDTLANVYAGFNLLLRENLAFGALKEWDLSPEHRETCRCDSQFTSKSCWPLRVTSSDQVPTQDDAALTRSPYVCSTCEHTTPASHKASFTDANCNPII